jgi:glutathione S-transferase
MTTYKFHYFNLKARGELVRIILANSGVNHEEVRYGVAIFGVPGVDFAPLKNSGALPFGQLPCLEIHDGGETRFLAQSGAIVRYLAHKFGIEGDCEGETAMIDSIYEGTGDVGTAIRNASSKGTDEEKAKNTDTFYNDTLPKWLGFFNNFMRPGHNWLVGTRLSYADLAVFNLLDALDQTKLNAHLANFPYIAELKQRVGDRLHFYLAHRPNSPF